MGILWFFVILLVFADEGFLGILLVFVIWGFC
jgi:hypothetical protein